MASAQVDNLTFSGFGTLGIMSSDSSRYGSRLDISQSDGSFNNHIDYKNSTALGLQLDYSLNNNTHFVFQSVYKNQSHLDLDTTTRLAFVQYSPAANWSLRVGRTAIDLFLLTQFRDVGFGYTWAHAPTEVYGLVPFRHRDGADITYQSKLLGHNLVTSIFAGQSRASIATYDFKTHIDLAEVYGLSFNLNAYNWSLQWRYSNASLNTDNVSYYGLIEGLTAISQIPGFNSIWPNHEITLINLENTNEKIDYISFAGQYDWQRWSYLIEASTLQPKQEIISDTTAAYASVIYHDDNTSYYGVYSVVLSNGINIDNQNVDLAALSNIPGGIDIYEGVEIAFSFYSASQSTLSLGWRWNISSNLALKFQWDHTQIDAHGGAIWLNKELSTSPKASVNTLFSNVSFIF